MQFIVTNRVIESVLESVSSHKVGLQQPNGMKIKRTKRITRTAKGGIMTVCKIICYHLKMKNKNLKLGRLNPGFK